MPHTVFRRRATSLPETRGDLSQDLPKHVFRRAFRYFSDPTNEIRELSKVWTSVDEYPFIWTNLVFRGNKISTDTICNILQNAPMLETLELDKVPEVETVLRQLCRSRNKLKHLSVRFCHSGEDMNDMISMPEATMRHVIQSCPLLTSLDIEGTPFHGKLFYEELLHLRRLRSLRIGCNSLLRSRDIQTVASTCGGKLTHFCLTQCPGGPPKPVRIFSPNPLKSLQQLKEQRGTLLEFTKPKSMESLPLTNYDCALLLRMMGPGLSVLELDAAGVDMWALQGILDCPGLRCLCLLNAKSLSGELVRDLPSAMPRLTHLILRGAPLVVDEDLLGFLAKGAVEKGAVPEGESTDRLVGDAVGEEVPEEPEKEWWEWGFWSDQEEDSSEEDLAVKNAEEKPEREEEMEEEEEEKRRKAAKVGMNTLDVSMCPYISDGLLQALSRSPAANYLQRLGLRGCQLVTDEGLGTMSSCIKLKHLDVSFVNGGEGPGPDWLTSVDSKHPVLQTLVVGWPKKKDDSGERKRALEKLVENTTILSIKRRLSCYHGRLAAIP